MTDTTRGGIAVAALWLGGGFNLAAVGMSIVRHDYGTAGVQSVLVALLAAWGWLVPKISATLDAKLGEAIAQRRMAELAAAAMERQLNAGHLEFGVSVQGSADRKH